MLLLENMKKYHFIHIIFFYSSLFHVWLRKSRKQDTYFGDNLYAYSGITMENFFVAIIVYELKSWTVLPTIYGFINISVSRLHTTNVEKHLNCIEDLPRLCINNNNNNKTFPYSEWERLRRTIFRAMSSTDTRGEVDK